MGWSLLVAVLLVAANAFFVAAEFALVKVRSTQLELRASEGSRAAGLARGMLDHLDGYLSACQLGITLASLGLGWIGEPAVAVALRPVLAQVGIADEATVETFAFVVAFSLISFAHITIGEQAPKNLAITHPETLAIAFAWPMRFFYVVLWPALVVVNGASNAMLRVLGVRVTSEHTLAVPADELAKIAAESAAEGRITQGQGTLLSKVFSFSDRVAREIMVPRNKVRGIDLRRPVDESLQFALESGHSRYLLYDVDIDGVVGVLHMKDLTPRLASGQPIRTLREFARPAMFVPETMPAHRLLRTFQRQRSHLAVVLDEFGGVTGIVTIEDTLEELVGEIQDEHDEERLPVETIEGGWSVEGRMLLSEIEALLAIPSIESEATTLSGLVMERLGRVAQVGDTVPIDAFAAKVVQVDRRSIERVEITKAAGAPA
jgi:CBS domain containing-hemolysin-like protein